MCADTGTSVVPDLADGNAHGEELDAAAAADGDGDGTDTGGAAEATTSAAAAETPRAGTFKVFMVATAITAGAVRELQGCGLLSSSEQLPTPATATLRLERKRGRVVIRPQNRARI